MPPDTRIVLAQPGTGVFVLQAALALQEAGWLQRFMTTIVDRPHLRWRQWLTHSHWLDAQLRRRAVHGLPAALVESHPTRELLRLLVRQFDRDGVWTDRVWEWSELDFDAWVARRGLDHAQAVYAYEHAALSTFEAAKARGMRCIYDVPAADNGFAQRVYDHEIAAHPELDNAYQRHLRKHSARRTARRRREWQAADVIIAGSEFSKSTYAEAGLDVSKVRVVPPGAPPVCPEGAERPDGHNPAEPMRFLFVGVVALHKGVHHLLEAWRRLKVPPGTATLELAGEIALPAAVLRNCPESVRLTGRLPPKAIFQRYRRSDALVFPALCDGFGMVVTEAFSQGLPVITTPRAGASELVRDGINGLIVPPSDPEALAGAIDWCLRHRTELYAMRAEARVTAAAWQWSDYRLRLAMELRKSPIFQAPASAVTHPV